MLEWKEALFELSTKKSDYFTEKPPCWKITFSKFEDRESIFAFLSNMDFTTEILLHGIYKISFQSFEKFLQEIVAIPFLT